MKSSQKLNIFSVGLIIASSTVLILTYHVTPIQSKGVVHLNYDCNRYCDKNCDDVSSPIERQECRKVHSHESDCDCHFGGFSFGLYIGLGLALVLVLSCCACRFFGKQDKAPANMTNIVVMTQPETVTTITHQGSDNKGEYSGKQVYQIETVPQASYKKNPTLKRKSPPEEQKSEDNNIPDQDISEMVTVVRSRKNTAEQISASDDPLSPTLSISERIFFVDVTTKEDSDDSVFSPPRY